tara:strand:- start:206 stop:796 length:591 start_codon:yes stop_codon:yes gene_type:complete
MTLDITRNKKYILKSIISAKLTNKEIKEICLLKDKEWTFGIKGQLAWFKNNIKKYDLHNFFYLKSKLVGYTLLRKRTYEIKKSNKEAYYLVLEQKFKRGEDKKTKYLLFDTLVIDKKYRGKNLSRLLMNFNNIIIKESGLFSFLICEDKLVNYYIKNKWKKLNKKVFKIIDPPFTGNGMIYNKSNFNKKGFFYINK